MAKKKFYLGILAMALVFGMTVVGCDDGATNGSETASVLNGTWVPTSEGHESWYIYKFNNGKFEIYDDGKGEKPAGKGIYTTNENEIMINRTHIHGANYWLIRDIETIDWLTGTFSENQINALKTSFESKFYSRADIKALGFDDELIDSFFISRAGSAALYSKNGNKLTITWDPGTEYEAIVSYNRK